ncbi:SMP-30/gluconolactonase/LRE family protein [Rhodoferax sp.]|uniref:SMP-30/gluconolactonase/LRE family protein n=1 Tax=Rhodoferax sp. TaxID=50421 RepID=UPI0025DC103B|nr:SMP-30/gluconolactonase/LRE family protein [Rhodoferax sp.]MCM2339621.1 SMP-30/gluconolactonase/LRE family protein [Rhodoferax sp.]
MKITTLSADALLCPEVRNAVGESPVWDVNSACWLWIDQAGKVFRLDPATGETRHWSVTEKIGSMVLRPDGGLVCCCETGIFDVELGESEAAGMTRLASITHPKTGMRFNDGRCDRQGRLWVSTMVMDISLGDASGSWFRYTRQEGLIASDFGDFVIPNGSAFSPDGKTFYCSDTHRDVRMLWQFDYDTDAGVPSNKRPFVDLRDAPGRPDGAAVDVDGCYWICGLDEGSIMRFTPQGKLDHKFMLPMQKPTMCSFGGADGQTMLVTSLCRGEKDLETDPHAGRLLMFRPGAQGIVEPRLLA